SPFEEEDPNIKITIDGPSSGVGAKRSWKSDKVGNGSQTIVASDPAHGMKFDLEIEGFPTFQGEFVYEPVAGGTKVTWTDKGDVGGSPINRWFAKMMDGMMGSTFDKGLADLEAAVVA